MRLERKADASGLNGGYGYLTESKPDELIEELKHDGAETISIHNHTAYILVNQFDHITIRFVEDGTQINLGYSYSRADKKIVPIEAVKKEAIRIAESLKPI